MSNLKNTYGFSASLLDAIRSVHETTHKEEVELEEGENPRSNLYVGTVKRSDPDYDEKIRKLKSKTVGGHRIRGRAPTPEHKHLYAVGGKLHRYSSQDIKPEHSSHVDVYSRNPMKEEVELDEADQTYPFKANQLAPLVVQLRSLLNFLSKSGALKKSMREHAELVEAYIGEEITEEQLEKMISFVDDLMEGRPKGSKNKSKMASAPKPAARTGKDEDEEDEEQEDVYKPASRDGRHILPELSSAADDKKGTAVQTSSGQRHVPQHVAAKMVKHLMSLKPIERAEHSTHIFNGSVPKVKTLNHIKTNVLIKQMGSEKKIGSDASVKRGRGRPKKAV